MIGATNPYAELGRQYEAAKTFTLPVSGSVVLFGPEIDLVQTPEFQRLAGIKQLGTSYVVYRGALHTRFEHSVGSVHQAEVMLRAIAGNPRYPYPIDDRARRLTRLGALLHDLPHVPFGHTLEDEFHLLRRHDENRPRIRRLLLTGNIPRILRRAIGLDDFDELCAVLRAKKDEEFARLQYPFAGDIVGNTVCADLLDYVQRDLLACGLSSAVGDRFLDYLSVTSDDGLPVDRRRLVLNLDKRGMPRPDVESEVVKLLTFRYELAERVYFHHAKNAASVMIGRAVQEAGLAVGKGSSPQLDANFHWVSDDLLLNALANVEVERAAGLVPSPEALGDRDLAQWLADRVLRRDLFKVAYLATWDDLPDAVRRISEIHGKDPASRRQLEDQIADAAGVPRGTVLVHVPRHRMMSKDADVRVRTDRGDVIKLHEWDARHSRRLAALNEAHARLWRVLVYLDPQENHAADVVRAVAEDEFLATSRYVPQRKVRAYHRALFDELSETWDLTAADARALENAPYAPEDDRRAAVRSILARVRQRRRDADLPALRKRTDG